MSYKVNIGLEFHIQLNTKHKLFSSSLNTYENEPNSQISLFDMAFPGTLPLINKEAISLALLAADRLHMHINHTLQFDRKHYFYSDLTKGYQITQELHPLAIDGYIILPSNNKRITIKRLHIEEDTCKQIHDNCFTYIDFNRSGVPLIELVTSPCIETSLEAKETVECINNLLKTLNISKGRMSDGSLRVDVNVSLSQDNRMLGEKVEIKNINTLANIKKAIEYEIIRQTNLLNNNESIKQETFRYDEKKHMNVLMRDKIDAIDYRSYIDPNLPPIKLTKKFILESVGNKNTELIESIKNLNEDKRRMILKNRRIYLYFLECLRYYNNAELLSNVITNECTYFYKQSKKLLPSFELVKLLEAYDNKAINKFQLKEIMKSAIENDISIKTLLLKEETKDKQTFDLDDIIIDVVNTNSNAVLSYIYGKEKALSYIIKQVIDITGTGVNIAEIKEKIIKEIELIKEKMKK